MNANLLIDAIVRQTTILIAQIATTAGIRAPLAHVANQVFMDLVRELRDQGLSNKVIADMFGVSLRTYHNTVRRLSEGRTVRGRSLWEAVLAHVKDCGTVSRHDVLAHFCHDDEVQVRGVLADLVESGLLFRTGRGQRTAYRFAPPEELVQRSQGERDSIVSLVWVTVYRLGPISPPSLCEALAIDDARVLESPLERLLAEGKIAGREVDGVTLYTATRCVVPLGAEEGWEAAVFDHYQAMVTAIVGKLRLAGLRSSRADLIGGSTFSCDVWDGHPLRDEVLGFLDECRRRGTDLVRRVDAYNEAHRGDPSSTMRVYSYVGQNVIQQQDSEEDA